MEKNKYIIETARILFLQLPWYKRKLYYKWQISNGWDVKGYYEKCLKMATFMYDDNSKAHLNTPSQ